MNINKNNTLTILLLMIGFLFNFSIYGKAAVDNTTTKTDVTSQPAGTIAPMLEKTTPAIVNIAVEKRIPQPPSSDGNNPPSPTQIPQQPQQPTYAAAVGSGVIFDAANGLIVTNAHVVADSRFILVTLKDGRRFPAVLVGRDPGFDIAIVKIPPIRLQSIAFGDSDQLKVGDFVAAIGSPFGLTQTVTTGIVSALNRATPQIEEFQSFIQTDTPINPGNSGGALVNMKGEVIGINTAMFTPTYGSIGIGFAIPSNMVQAVLEQLLKYGKVERGLLGVVVQEISPELSDALKIKQDQGVLVSEVLPGTPAENTGIKVEDVIEKLNGKPVSSANQLRNSLGLMRPGTPVTLTVSRNHTSMTFSTKVGNPNALKAHMVPFLGGMRLQDFNELQADGTLLKGIGVNDIDETSPAAIAGVQPGDVITQANETTITNVNQLIQIANNTKDHLLLKVSRGNLIYFVVVLQ